MRTQKTHPSASPSMPKAARKAWHIPMFALLVVAVGAAAGCGSSTTPTSAAPTVVVTQTVAAPPAETVTQTVQATSTAPETTVEAVEPSPSAVAKPVGKIVVPDGVGMNYQEAQDAWRAAGLHVAPADDATGANRVPVLDRNWVVLSQDLEAGSKVSRDSFITATIKKYTDG